MRSMAGRIAAGVVVVIVASVVAVSASASTGSLGRPLAGDRGATAKGSAAVGPGPQVGLAASSGQSGTGRAVGGSTRIMCPLAPEGSLPSSCWPTPFLRLGADGSVQGVTTTGQASVNGQGTQGRDQAIRQAIEDAREQAQVAADAAGVTLGKVIDMEVSSSGVTVPVPAPGPPTANPGAPPSCPSPVPSGVVCKSPPVIEPGNPLVPAQTFASVTVTWAIAS